MGLLLFLIIVIVGLPFLGWYIGGAIGGFLDNIFGTGNQSNYVDKSTHYLYHKHEHKNSTVIDEETHKKELGHLDDKRDSKGENL